MGGSGREELKKIASLPPLVSYELRMFVKENPDRNKNSNNITGKSQYQYLSFLCIELVKIDLRLLLLVGSGRVCVLSNQIARFFDQQYRWKEPMNVFHLLHRDNHQGEVATKTTTFGCVWPPVQSDCRIL